MAKVNPSEMRAVIKICESAKVKEKGITTYKYKVVTRLRAKVKNDKINLFYDSDTRKRNHSLVIYCYKNEHLIEDNFILYKEKYYRITQVDLLDDYIFCQVFCEKVE
ncbi:MAG: head-tail adaptor protein [Clostridia bacterium]|nr:head-tail adaptor protein [Clostridia bacterium]